MANAQSSKGNPASTRMSRKTKTACRARSWANGQARKAANRAAQNAREQANRDALAADPTYMKPWDRAKAIRNARRLTLHHGIAGFVTYRGKAYPALKRGAQVLRQHAKSGEYQPITGKVAASFVTA